VVIKFLWGRRLRRILWPLRTSLQSKIESSDLSATWSRSKYLCQDTLHLIELGQNLPGHRIQPATLSVLMSRNQLTRLEYP
jgi:hypothetical protein